MLNARDAAQRGAHDHDPHPRHQRRAAGRPLARSPPKARTAAQTHQARALVNAGGPWVEDVIRNVARINSTEGVRLVRGSHIVTRKLFDHDRCYFFQGADGRIIFAIPYEQDFTLIGTTDKDHQGAPKDAHCTDEERDYLLAFASQYFAKPVTSDDVVWTYSGVRPLYNDGAKSATAATRDYVLIAGSERRAAAERVRRQDHHLPPSGRKRAGEAGAVLPAGQSRPGPPACPCPAAISRMTAWPR